MKRLLALVIATAGGLGCSSPGSSPGADLGKKDGRGPGGPADLSFTTETVDATAEGNGTAILFDRPGQVNVFYFGKGAEMDCNLRGNKSKYKPAQLFHATRAGGGWNRIEVSAGDKAEANGVGADIDPRTGLPVLSYQGGMPGSSYCGGSDVMLTRFDGAKWNRSTVATKSTAGTGQVEMSGDVVGPWSAVGFDKAGTLYMAWQDIHFGFAKDDFYKADLEFAVSNGGGFVFGDEVDAAGAGHYIVMALDGQGRPVLAYSGQQAGGVTVALRTSPMTWSKKSLAQGSEVVPSLAAAPKSGRLGVAYYDTGRKVLVLAESDDGIKWPDAPELVDSDGDVGRYVSLRYDADDRPVLAYFRCGDAQACDDAKSALRVARKDARGAWQIVDVDGGSGGACGAFPSVAVGPDGKAAVVYQCNVFDHQSGNFKATVKYAKQD